MHCLFCDIIEGRSPAEVLVQTEHAIAILDINPIHYGHALVIPRTHARTLLEVPDGELQGLMQTAKTVSGAIVQVYQPEGFNIFSNNGRAAGQSVFHFHLHITPRYADDNIKFVLKLKKYGADEMSACADRLRREIQAAPVRQLP